MKYFFINYDRDVKNVKIIYDVNDIFKSTKVDILTSNSRILEVPPIKEVIFELESFAELTPVFEYLLNNGENLFVSLVDLVRNDRQKNQYSYFVNLKLEDFIDKESFEILLASLKITQ